jgi:hypothetical protein
MGRRKGELSSAAVDRDWPHQISLSEAACCGVPNHDVVEQFAKALSFCTRGHTYSHQGTWYRVFCFKEKVDAQKFKDRFNGEWFDPARRGRGSRWHILREPKKRYY